MARDGPFPTPLAKLLAGQGPMPFRDYMAEALYAPKHGFYTRRDVQADRTRPTGRADYHAALADRLADRFTEFSQGQEARWVDHGPGSGRVTRAVLSMLDEALLERMEVVFIEPALARRTRLLAVLQEFGVSGRVVGPPRDLGHGPAFVVAKELFSSFPVHWLERTGDGWSEVEVTFAADAWAATESLDAAPSSIELLLPGKANELAPGARYEVNAQLPRVLADIANAMTPGRLVVLDRFAPRERGPTGTVQAVRRGEAIGVYDAPGEAELSAAIDPVALGWAAQEAGLREVDELPGLGAPQLDVRVFA